MTAVLPTTRAAVLLAAAAPVALLIAALAPAAWIVAPLLGAAIFAAVLVDAALAGSLAEVRAIVPPDAEVGAEQPLAVLADLPSRAISRVEAAVATDPRLAPGGRLALALDRDPASGAWQGSAPFTPVRRGAGAVSRLWLRWEGPLGLGARQTAVPLAAVVRVRPNLAAVRSPALQLLLRDPPFGIVARRLRGEGSEFEALAEYQPGMDRRRIEWKASARHGHLYAKENEAERNNPIVFAFDCGQAMCEPVRGLPRIDRAVSAALTTAYVALKGGDRIALFGFAARVRLATPFVIGSAAFHRLQCAAAELDYAAEEPNFTLALATLAGRLQRRSLIVVFSDFTDPTSAELMVESIGRLVARHFVLFVTFADEELGELAGAAPDDLQTVASAVTAEALLRQRALVTRRLQQLGVEVLEAPWDRVGPRLLDAYLAIKARGAIG
ncbi:MAG: DUF58 domain-containing protein [Novosphingobium sp.]|nr:DUF58 domain-containing protein [Novosphingobium sp.]